MTHCSQKRGARERCHREPLVHSSDYGHGYAKVARIPRSSQAVSIIPKFEKKKRKKT